MTDALRLADVIVRFGVRTVVDETYDAFAGTGPDLQRLLDNSASFVGAAKENLPQTTRLLSGQEWIESLRKAEGTQYRPAR